MGNKKDFISEQFALPSEAEYYGYTVWNRGLCDSGNSNDHRKILRDLQLCQGFLPIRWWLCNHLIPGVEMWVSKALDKLICYLRNEWSPSSTTFACQEMEGIFENFEFGLNVSLWKTLLTCPLLSCAYSTDGITICDCQEGILKAKEKCNR